MRTYGVFALMSVAVMLCMSFSSGCSKPLSRAEIGHAQPVSDLPGVNNLSRDGSFYFAAQPSRETLEAAAGQGVRVVVNLRTADEMQIGVGFDEPATARALGIRYVEIPIAPNTFSAQDADQLHRVLETTSDPVLIHCGTSNRVGALWALYLARHRGVTIEEAIERGRRAGLRSDALAETVRREATR